MKTHIVAGVTGVLFGLGLAISEMVNPFKVMSFLDVFGNWDPSLLLVIGAATGFTMLSFIFVLKQEKPFFADAFSLPTKSDLDRKLILGSALFGTGWGLAGYCPGPGLAALTLGTLEPIVFILFVVIGSRLPQMFKS